MPDGGNFVSQCWLAAIVDKHQRIAATEDYFVKLNRRLRWPSSAVSQAAECRVAFLGKENVAGNSIGNARHKRRLLRAALGRHIFAAGRAAGWPARRRPDRRV